MPLVTLAPTMSAEPASGKTVELEMFVFVVRFAEFKPMAERAPPIWMLPLTPVPPITMPSALAPLAANELPARITTLPFT